MAYTETKKALNQLVADLVQAHTVIHQIHWYMRGKVFFSIIQNSIALWMIFLNSSTLFLNV